MKLHIDNWHQVGILMVGGVGPSLLGEITRWKTVKALGLRKCIIDYYLCDNVIIISIRA